jgi:hypothetical protein
LTKEKAGDPLRFSDLSLSVIKLMGPGEYVAELPGETAPATLVSLSPTMPTPQHPTAGIRTSSHSDC